MKTSFFAILAVAFLSFSCSSDDDSASNDGLDLNFLPLSESNTWNYEVVAEESSFDNLYVGETFSFNDKTYNRMKTTAEPSGFYSLLLRENGLRKSGGSSLLSGTLSLDLGLDSPFEFVIEDFTILKDDAENNDVLSTKTGTISQTIQDIPVTIDYTIKTIALENLPSFTTSQSVSYDDVKKVKLTISLKVVATQVIEGIPIPLTITLLNTQDVLTATHYYAKNIGMVYAENLISYTLAVDPSEFDLPVPQSASQTQNEFLDSYTVN